MARSCGGAHQAWRRAESNPLTDEATDPGSPRRIEQALLAFHNDFGAALNCRHHGGSTTDNSLDGRLAGCVQCACYHLSAGRYQVYYLALAAWANQQPNNLRGRVISDEAAVLHTHVAYRRIAAFIAL